MTTWCIVLHHQTTLVFLYRHIDHALLTDERATAAACVVTTTTITMDDLLSDFDPLHPESGRTKQLFPSISTSTSILTSQSTTAAADHVAVSAESLPSKPVSIATAPLDLLSLDDEHEDDLRDGNAGIAVQNRAQQRRQGILSELAHAEQQPGWHAASSTRNATSSFNSSGATQTAFPSQSAVSTSPQTGSFSPSSSRGPRRTSSGFAPPRRMSRSGLMYDEHSRQSFRGGLAGSPTTSASALASFPSSSSPTATNADLETLPGPSSNSRVSSNTFTPAGSNLIDLNTPGPSNVSFNREPLEPDELFHPSSPIPGSALESMRTSSYFGSIGRSNGFKSSKASAHTLDPARQPSADTVNGVRATGLPASEAASTSQAQLPKPTTVRTQPTKKKTFDFSKAFSEPSSPSDGLPSQLSQQRNGISPSHTLAIDAEPLPSVSLKSSTVVRNLILTEEIADGIRAGFTSRLRLYKSWSLLYSLDAHGTSLATLYARVQAGLSRSGNGCVLCVRDMRGRIFGAYVTEAFKKHDSYYGTGDWSVNDSCAMG